MEDERRETLGRLAGLLAAIEQQRREHARDGRRQAYENAMLDSEAIGADLCHRWRRSVEGGFLARMLMPPQGWALGVPPVEAETFRYFTAVDPASSPEEDSSAAVVYGRMRHETVIERLDPGTARVGSGQYRPPETRGRSDAEMLGSALDRVQRRLEDLDEERTELLGEWDGLMARWLEATGQEDAPR